MASEATKPDILNNYLEENPSVRQLLKQYAQAKEVIEKAELAESATGLLYPFYSYTANF